MVVVEPELVRVNGPKGELTQRVSGDIRWRRPTARCWSAGRPTAASTAPCTGSPAASSSTWSRASPRATRSGWRSRAWATAPSSRARTSSWRWATRTRCRSSAPDGIEFEVPSPTEIVVRGISKQAGGRDRRPDPQEAPARALQGQGHPLQGRARGQEGRQARMSVKTKQHEAAPPAARAGQGARQRRAPAAVRVPLQPRHGRPADRRRARAHAWRRSPGPSPTCASWRRWSRRSKAGEAARRAGQGGRRESCVFDRGGYRFHGRVKALADGAREAGLSF